MERGFTIKCNKCGNETTYKPKSVEGYIWGSTKDNSNVTIKSDRDEDIYINCKCGKPIEIDYNLELGELVTCAKCGTVHQFSLEDEFDGETERLYNVLFLEE